MENQRIRNLTTGVLHTSMNDIYEDVEFLIGETGVMTHMLPEIADTLRVYLLASVTDARFWEKKYDPSHTGETVLSPMNAQQREDFFRRLKERRALRKAYKQAGAEL